MPSFFKNQRLSLVFLLIFTLVIPLISCQKNEEDTIPTMSQENTNEAASPTVQMEATVTKAGAPLTVEVNKSQYTFGTHIVHLSENTHIQNASGQPISTESIRVGDRLTILYSGQVMLSYPPQIVALSITVK